MLLPVCKCYFSILEEACGLSWQSQSWAEAIEIPLLLLCWFIIDWNQDKRLEDWSPPSHYYKSIDSSHLTMWVVRSWLWRCCVQCHSPDVKPVGLSDVVSVRSVNGNCCYWLWLLGPVTSPLLLYRLDWSSLLSTRTHSPPPLTHLAGVTTEALGRTRRISQNQKGRCGLKKKAIWIFSFWVGVRGGSTKTKKSVTPLIYLFF